MNTFVTLATGVLPLSYTTSVALIAGQTYKFTVQARNLIGLSSDSAVLSILAATLPSTPAAPTTSIYSQSVVINWIAPYNGGTAITSYTIQIKKSDGTYALEANCDGTQATIITNK